MYHGRGCDPSHNRYKHLLSLGSPFNLWWIYFSTGRYHSLKKELERLKVCVAYSSIGDVEKDFSSSSAAEGVSLDAAWQMLDIGKLNLNPRN